ncbi:Hypothetical protein PEIBARAKI_5991 [Petrimonas sp. IBARAKI]|nr:Hypothetical protein PEIBARAKI_5991 [Petrimonas sp. IBARAKI]
MLQVDDQIVEAVKSIKALLEAGNVKKIIYIDDRFDYQYHKEIFIGLLRTLRNRLNHLPGRKPKYNFVQSWQMAEPAFSQFAEQKWNNATIPEREKYLTTLYTKLNEPDYLAVNILEDSIGDLFLTFTPTQWSEQKEILFGELQDYEKYLCLFDYELNDGRKGGQLVQSLLNSPNAPQVYCGIYSHILEPYEEHEKKEEWAKSLGVSNFYPISKKRLQNKPSIAGFCNGLRNVLLVKDIEELKTKSLELINASFDKVKDRIDKIHPDTFNYVVQRSSLGEGIWEIETFLRLSNVLMDQETKRSLLPKEIREQYNGSINHIRSIDLIETINPDRFYQEQTKIIEEEEKYYSSEIINRLHYPLRNGDILRIKEKEYILLCQPCNLSVRNNGKRANGIDNAFLLEIHSKDKFINSDIAKIDTSREGEIKSFNLNSNQIRYVKFSQFTYVQLLLLDLVMYQDDGIAKIDLNISEESLPHSIHLPLVKRYKELRKEYRKYAEILTSYSTIINGRNDNHKRTLDAYINKPKYLSDFKINGAECYHAEHEIFEFPIKRIRHYKSTYSTELLKKFMDYLSRTGFDKDFI